MPREKILTCPVFAMILVFGNNVTTSNDFSDKDHPVESCIGHEASNQTIRGLERE
jgi:hypothetical protein